MSTSTINHQTRLKRWAITVLIASCECYYLCEHLLSNHHISVLAIFLSCFCLLSFFTALTFIPKKARRWLLFIMLLPILWLLKKYHADITEFITHCWLVITKYTFLSQTYYLTIMFLFSFVLCLIHFFTMLYYDVLLFNLLFSLSIISGIFIAFQQMTVLFAMIYLFPLLFILLWWIYPKLESYKFTKKELLSQLFFVVIVLSIALLAPLLGKINTEPLAWIDDYSLFKESTINRKVGPSNYVPRVDAQNKLSRLSSEFYPSQSTMLIVKSPYLMKLRGRTFDQYDGQTWEDTLKGQYPVNHTLSTYTQTLDDHHIPYHLFNIEIKLNAESSVIYAPMHSNLQFDAAPTLFSDANSDLFVEDPLNPETTYTVTTVKVDQYSEAFLSMIKNSTTNKENMESYLSIPTSLPDRVAVLAQELTREASSDFDKAKLIEQYLSSQYIYTLEPPEKPKRQDYVDYFLFDSKQGFCTHYASAMTMLLRSIQIPCRYVTGYAMQPSSIDWGEMFFEGYIEGYIEDYMEPTYEEGIEHTFYVKKRQSHAWVEVWFDDFGWVSFEPTSGYRYEPINESPYVLPDVNIKKSPVISHPKQPIKVPYTLLIVIGGIVVTLLFIRKAKQKKKRSNQQKVIDTWYRICRLYANKKEKRQLSETAQEFVHHVNNPTDSLLRALTLFEQAAYSNNVMTNQQVDEINLLFVQLKKTNHKQKHENFR